MRFGVAVLLTLIGYFVVKAVWRLYRAIREDRPNSVGKSKQSPFLDKFGRKQEIEDVRWRDLP